MTQSWRPEGWVNYCGRGFKYGGWTCPDDEILRRICASLFEAGADAMHEADVKWLIERIIHDDRGYVFKMSDREWQSFINDK